MRLIDANALLEKLDALSEIFRRRGESEDKGFLAVQCGVTFAEGEVKSAATMDAVPVVRCEDCRNSSKIANSTKGERHCWSLRGRNNGDGFSRVNGDGFCDEGAFMDADAPERGEGGGMNHWRETLNRDNPHLVGDVPICVPFKMYRNGKSESWVINPSKDYPGAYDLSRLTYMGRQVVNGAQTPEQCLIMAYQHM